MRGIKNGHLIGRRNDVNANMAALALYMCLAASRFSEAKTLRAPHFGLSQASSALAQTFTVIVWCEVTALGIGTWVFLFRYLGTLAVSAPGC